MSKNLSKKPQRTQRAQRINRFYSVPSALSAVNFGLGTKPWKNSLLAIILGSFFLRLYRMADRSVWWDEGWSIWVARQSFADILHQTGNDVHPPLYFWLLHIWRMASGDSEFGLRLLSVLLGTLTVTAVYLLGRTIGGKKVGLLAALFLAVSRFPIAWSQEIRMYALASLLAVLGVWAAIRAWDEERPFHYLLYILFMAAGLHTVYLFFPVPVAVNIAWLWVYQQSKQRRPALLKWAAAQIAILLLLAPWLNFALRGFLTTSSATPISVTDFLKIYWTVLVVGIPMNVERYIGATLPVLAVFLGGLTALFWQARRDGRMARHIALLLTGLLIPLGVVIYVTIPKSGAYAPPFSPRYLVIFTGYFAILLAWGIMRLVNKRWLPIFSLSAIVIYAAWVGLRGFHASHVLLDDYNSLAMTIEAYKRPSDTTILFTDTDWPIFAYHHPDAWHGVPHAWHITPSVADEFLAPIWARSDGVWLVVTPYAGVSDPQGEMMNWLAARATAVTITPYEDKSLHFYARTQERAGSIPILNPDAEPRWKETAVLAPNWQLIGHDLALRDARSGDTVHLFLYGQGDAAAAQVGFVDEQGQVWQETAITLPASPHQTARQQVDLLVSPDTPSGSYNLFIRDNQGALVRLSPITLRQKQSIVLTPADVTIANRLDADFEAGIRLLGYEVETESPQPGGTVYLTLYWQAQEPVAVKYKIFTHLLGEVYNADNDNFLWGQQDNEPVNNTRPTTTWRSGEVIVDSYAIPIAAHAPPGSYQIEMGLYDPATGVRLLTPTGDDYLILTAVEVQ